MGEGLDVELAENKVAKLVDILQMYELKTANYTVAGPLILGCNTWRSNMQKSLKIIAEFGKNLGIAFQIKENDISAFLVKKKKLENRLI